MQDEPDLVLVNPGGRVVVVPNDLGQELLRDPAFKRATDAQVKEYNAVVAASAPEVLAKQEAARVAAADKAAEAVVKAQKAPKTVAPAPEPEVAGQDAEQPADKPKSRKSN